MDDDRIPRQVLLGELAEGKRAVGRPKLRFKDICKNSMEDFSIDCNDWENLASDRSAWRSSLRTAAKNYDNVLLNKLIQKRQTRKDGGQNNTSLICSHCGRICKSMIGRISHERSCSIRQQLPPSAFNTV